MIQCSRSITLFKLVMFHRQRKRLPRTWSSDYINELAELRGIDNAKWQKLMQLV